MIDWDKQVISPLQSVFGEETTYTPAGGAPFAITGVFDRAFRKKAIFDDGSISVQTTSPVLGVRLLDFAISPVQNDRVFIPSVNTTFVVREIHSDGHGWAKLVLNKVSSP